LRPGKAFFNYCFSITLVLFSITHTQFERDELLQKRESTKRENYKTTKIVQTKKSEKLHQ